ncbi:sensor histidine kinase [Lentzea kentuckyensis]|uniref:sensor histidine kinase n=1 Tax=Lentzea kentuckyensis TaxID=360086 RepID=UPI00130295EC|nr:ATP-binding protein [Lentzea kentuckyensis]
MRMGSRGLVVLGCLGLLGFGGLLWAIVHTSRPPLPAVVVIMLVVVALAVGPWVALVHRKLRDDPEAGGLFRVVVASAVAIAVGGIVIATGLRYREELASPAVMLSVLVAGAVALVGAAVFPWLFLTTRMLARERAARARAEERADLAAHLHDSVLQALTLIQKQADSTEVRRLARGTERDLRTWLYGRQPLAGNDFSAAVTATAEVVEDTFDVVVELVSVGTCAMDTRSRAVVGAVREALTNAAKHGGVGRVSVFAEVSESEVFALVRDRGRGFDPAVHSGANRRGIADSIERRMRHEGGNATIRTALGGGTEVELRMPLGRK